MSDRELGNGLTKEQEASLVYRLEQEPSLWLILLQAYVVTRGEQSACLKAWLIDDTPEWQALAAKTRAQGFEPLKQLACTRLVQWHVWLRQLMADPGHLNLLSFYLRNLVALKNRKVREIGARAEAQKRLNGALAVVARDALAHLDRYRQAAGTVASGQTSGGRPLTREARAFYAARETEHATQLALIVAITLLLRDATSPADTRRLQEFVRANLLGPWKGKRGAMSGTQEQALTKSIERYTHLLDALEIAF